MSLERKLKKSTEFLPYVDLLCVIDLLYLSGKTIYLFGTAMSFLVAALMLVSLLTLSILVYVRSQWGRFMQLLLCDLYVALVLPTAIFSIFTHNGLLAIDVFNVLLSLCFAVYIFVLTDTKVKELFV